MVSPISKISCHFMLFLLTFACVCLLVGCGEETSTRQSATNTPTETDAANADGEPAYGGMIVRGSIGDASVLLPVLASDSGSFDITNLIYNGLVKYNKNIKLVGDIAKDWEISDDKLRIRFFLRDDVTWQDGTPFTVKDVKFTYELYTDPQTPTAYASDFLRVQDFRVLDDHTFEVSYETPYAPALGSWGQAMHPAHLLEGKDVTKSPLKRKPVGTGPYVFQEWRTGEKIVVDANSGYFAGRPYIGRVMTRIIPDPATMFLELKAERIDQMVLTPLQYQRQTESEWFKKHFNKFRYYSFAYAYLGYNLLDWKFQDKRVRQALTMAIDREGLVNGVLLGLGKVAHTPYKPDTIWYNDKVKKWPYDPEKAKQQLADAGWTDTDGDGVLDKDGKPFAFTIITNQGNESRKNAATIIQRDLKKVGITVSIRVIEWAAFLKNFINKKKFEAALLGWSIGIDPNQMDIWNSEKTGAHELNFVSYKNEKVDDLLEKAVSVYDPAERKRYYDEFQAIIAEDQPYTFLWVPESLPIIHARFQGIKPAPAGIGYNFEKWYVPKTRQKYAIQP